MQAIATVIAFLQAATTTTPGQSTSAMLIELAIEVGVAILFIQSLSRTLEKCSPPSRAMGTGSLWLLLIPLFNRIWLFVVVSNMAKSLSNEFRARGIPSAEAEPGQSEGMIMGITGLGSIAVALAAPSLGYIAHLIYAVFYGLYWRKINQLSRMLDTAPAPMAGYPMAGYPPIAGPPAWPQGYPPQGYAPGVAPQGYAPGTTPQGFPQSAAPQGTPPEGWPQR